MNIEVKTVKVDDIEMDYFRFGTVGKPAVVVLPGLALKAVMLNAGAIARQYDFLSKDFDVYVLERRTNVAPGYTIADMAEDSYKVVKAIGIDRANVIGVSQGGMIAQALGIKHPEYLISLVLTSTISAVDAGNQVLFDKWIEQAKERKTEELLQDFAQYVYTEEYCQKNAKAIKTMARFVTDEDLDRFVIFASALSGLDLTDNIRNIKCKTLVVASMKDKIFDYKKALQLAGMLFAESTVYPGYSHALYDECPDYLDRLYKFLKENN